MSRHRPVTLETVLIGAAIAFLGAIGGYQVRSAEAGQGGETWRVYATGKKVGEWKGGKTTTGQEGCDWIFSIEFKPELDWDDL